MKAPRLAATRVNLLRARRQLTRVEKGAGLLKRKREALVRELFRLARPAADLRTRIGAGFLEAYDSVLRALALHGRTSLRAMAWPERDLVVEIEPNQVWGINVSDIVERPRIRRTVDARGLAPGSTGPSVAETATQFENLAELLLDAAAGEERIRRLGDAAALSARRVRTLEQRITPRLQSQIASVQRTLEEREREEHLRLKRVQQRRATAQIAP